MENNIASGEILSFIDLLEKNKIEIPIIQRDYAQGRTENSVIRQDFLQALKDSVIENKKLKLDFIYGEIVDDTFQPLDGQQRLTTLFLLHWYAIAKEGAIPENIINLLSKFTYETRISSREFCNDLVKKSIIITDKNRLSEQIKDANWFYLSWKQDPSIVAMLNTLDDIYELFFDINDLWELLTGQKLITFHYLNLQDLGLSDDLYIKMNARGKLLTPFENFKAQFQKRIEDNEWEMGYDAINKFDYKIDTHWTDFFWSKFGNRIDAAHIKFISAIIMNRVALGTEINSLERYAQLRRLNENKDGRYLINFIDKNVYDYIYLCYEIFSNLEKNNTNLNIIDSEIKFWNHSCKDSVLFQISSDDSSYTQKVLFFAQTEFLRRTTIFNREAYLNWMRVIRNFVCYSNITIKTTSSREDLVRAPEAFNSMIILVNTLADGCSDIYKFLENFDDNAISYRREQVREEIIKAKKIRKNPEIRDIIWKLEDLNLFRGRIYFIFECITEASFNLNTSDENKLEKMYEIFSEYFNDDKYIGADFNKAMLTIDVDGEYKYYDYWRSYWYVGNAQKRKFIVSLNELQYYIYNDSGVSCKRYFMILVLSLLTKSYQDILNDFTAYDSMPTWKKKLIKSKHLLKNHLLERSAFFAFTEDNLNCFLLDSQKPQSIDRAMPI